MPGSFGYGEKAIGLQEMMVSPFNPFTGVQGTPVFIPEANKLLAKPMTNSDETKAQFAVTSMAGWTEAFEFEFSWAGLSFDTMVTLLGSAFVKNSESGTTPNAKTMGIWKARTIFNYFSVAGYSLGENNTGFAQGFWKAMISECEIGQAEDGKYLLSNVKGKCLAHLKGSVYEFGRYRRFETGITFDATAFTALFTEV